MTTKIKQLDDLCDLVTSAKEDNKKIVHCHGVFDPLHIGHIRHFEQAKKLGDALVVTVTPDQFVNKGPHRPVFTEDLRIEAIAALDIVDYVSINLWPTAVETIRMLRPNLYVKGSDYNNSSPDHINGIEKEISALKEIGGEIYYTDEVTFSASHIINRHLEVFPENVREYLCNFSNHYSSSDVVGYLSRARNSKVLVVGEAVIDEYCYCETVSKSAKEPMLAVKHMNTEKFAGGILAIGNNISNFCEDVSLMTFLGETNSQDGFIQSKLNSRIQKSFLYRKNSPTIVNRRFIDHYFFSKMLQVFEMNDAILDKHENERFCSQLEAQIPKYDMVVVADLGYGMLTREAIEILSRLSKFLVVNSQSNAGNLGFHTISKYPRADYICIAEHEIRLEARDMRGDLKKVICEISKRMNCRYIIVTRGSRGCLCYSVDEGIVEIPAFAVNVVDRMGAGDAFLALTGLCALQSAPIEITGFIGNAAGAQATATVGNKETIKHEQIVRQIDYLLK